MFYFLSASMTFRNQNNNESEDNKYETRNASDKKNTFSTEEFLEAVNDTFN